MAGGNNESIKIHQAIAIIIILLLCSEGVFCVVVVLLPFCCGLVLGDTVPGQESRGLVDEVGYQLIDNNSIRGLYEVRSLIHGR